MGEIFKQTEIAEGINANGEHLTNLRFADDVALVKQKAKQIVKKTVQTVSTRKVLKLANICTGSDKINYKLHRQ